MAEINENDSLFTDYALEMLAAFLDPDRQTISSLIGSYSSGNENSAAFLPGVLFGSMYHLSIVMAKIAEALDKSVEEVFQEYAMDYHLHIRDTLKSIKGLHPSYAADYLEKIATSRIENGEELDLEY